MYNRKGIEIIGERKMRKRYANDTSWEEYEKIKEYLEETKTVMRPRKYELYDIFCAVLYIVKEGRDYPWLSKI